MLWILGGAHGGQAPRLPSHCLHLLVGHPRAILGLQAGRRKRTKKQGQKLWSPLPVVAEALFSVRLRLVSTSMPTSTLPAVRGLRALLQLFLCTLAKSPLI